MISTFLAEHRWIAIVALLGTIAVAPLVGRMIAPRPRPTWALAAVSLLAVLALTLLPDNRIVAPGCANSGFTFSLFAVESVANILLLLPSTFLVGIATRKPWWSILGGSAFSALIELVQAFVPAIGRSCDTSDWVTNTVGAVIGGVLAFLSLRLASSRQQRKAGRR